MFDLNNKGDAAEAMATMLKVMHGAYIDEKSREQGKSLEEQLDLECDSKCFVHDTVYLKMAVKIKCKCGQQKEL